MTDHRPPYLQNKGRRKLLRLSLFAIGGSLYGCGFKLRGAVQLPFTALWSNFPATSSVGNEFKRALRTSNPQLQFVDVREKAQVVLNVLAESKDKLVLGLSSAGVVREYQLQVTLRYELLDGKGRELTAAQDIILKRDVTTSDAQIVAKEREDELLFREMQNDLIQQLMRRLAAIRLAAQT
jgi:LPS-assembly lipoprotein